MSVLIVVVGLTGALLAGVAVVGLLRGDYRGGAALLSTSELLGAGLAAGIVLCAWVLFVWSWCGGSLGAPVSWGLAAAGGAAGATPVLTRWRRQRADDSRARSSMATRCLQVGVTGLLILAAVQTLLTPQRFWDERAIFAIKARVLFLDRSIHSPTLAHPDFVQGHPRYPLLIPLAEQHLYALLGRDDDRWSKALFPALFAALVLSFAGVLQRHTTPERAWLCALLLASTPVLFPYELGFQSAQADAPMACFHGLALLYAWHGLRRHGEGRAAERGDWMLAGLFAAAAAFTKDEGIAYLGTTTAALCVAWAVGAWHSWPAQRGQPSAAHRSENPSAAASAARAPAPEGASSRRRQAAAAQLLRVLTLFAAPVVIVLVPWFLHRRSLPTTTEMDYFGRLSLERLAGGGVRLRWIAGHLVSRMFLEWREWGLQWWLAAVAAAAAPRRALRPEQLFLLLDVAGALAALALAGLIAPAELHDHIGGSSHRYLMQLVPAAMLFAAGQCLPDSGDRLDRPAAVG